MSYKEHLCNATRLILATMYCYRYIQGDCVSKCSEKCRNKVVKFDSEVHNNLNINVYISVLATYVSTMQYSMIINYPHDYFSKYDFLALCN